MMELFQLEYFVRIAEAKNMSRAAGMVHVSQPALSAQIRALEEELGSPLFIRDPKGLSLTGFGESVYEEAVRILGRRERIIALSREVSPGKERLEVKIAVNTRADRLKVDRILERIRTSELEVRVSFLQDTSSFILDGIGNERYDIGFVFGAVPSGAFTVSRLTDVVCRLFCSGHYREKLKWMTVNDLARMPWVLPPDYCPFHALIRNIFGTSGRWPENVVIAEHEEITKTLVASGYGASVLPEYELEGCEGIVVSDEFRYAIPLNLVMAGRKPRDERIRRVFECIESVFVP